MLKLLIDADMFVFISCASCEREVNWGNDIWTLHVDFQEAKATLIDKLNYAIESSLQKMMYSGNYEVIFCFSDESNFRKKVLPTYKANRVGKRKPVCYKAMVDYIKENFKTCQKPTLEADDCIGILATMKVNKNNSIVISGDKDLKSIPAYHYDFIHDEFFNVSEAEADFNFLMQTLTGDTTDGYSGCPSIGKVNAERILKDNPTWQAVVDTYKKKKLSEDVALQQARVARILRASDYDFTKKEVRLWLPQSVEH